MEVLELHVHWSVTLLSILAKILAFVSSFLLIARQWIVRAPEQRSRELSHPSDLPLAMSVIHGLVGSLCLVFFIWLAMMPWILLLALAPQHLWMVEICLILAQGHRNHTKEFEKQESESDDDRFEIDRMGSLKKNLSIFVSPLLSATATDAALILFTSEIHTTLDKTNWVEVGFSWFALLVYLISWWGDARLMDFFKIRWLPARQDWPAMAVNLGVVLALRIGFAWIVNTPRYPIWELVTRGNATWPDDRPDDVWFSGIATAMPSWSPMLMNIFAMAFMIIGLILLRQSTEAPARTRSNIQSA